MLIRRGQRSRTEAASLAPALPPSSPDPLVLAQLAPLPLQPLHQDVVVGQEWDGAWKNEGCKG